MLLFCFILPWIEQLLVLELVFNTLIDLGHVAVLGEDIANDSRIGLPLFFTVPLMILPQVLVRSKHGQMDNFAPGKGDASSHYVVR